MCMERICFFFKSACVDMKFVIMQEKTHASGLDKMKIFILRWPIVQS